VVGAELRALAAWSVARQGAARDAFPEFPACMVEEADL
jgi:hypothetical protein